MRAVVSISLSLGIILGPFAQAQSPSALGVTTNIYATQVARYSDAKTSYIQKGVQAFVASYGSLLSRIDTQFLITQLSTSKVILPVLVATNKGFDLSSSDMTVAFDLSHMHEGYAMVSGTRVSTNFGGSLEEISMALERVLKQKHPKQFDKELSFRISDLLIKRAHAGNALVWGSIAAIIAALIFKGVYDAKTAKKKKETAKKPAFVDEPAAPQGTAYAAAGGEPIADYSQMIGPHNLGGVIPPRPPARTRPPATVEVDDNEEEEALADVETPPTTTVSVKPEPATTLTAPPPAPVEIAEAGAEDYKTYEAAFCNSDTRVTISAIMSDILQEHGEKFTTYNTQRQAGFREARRAFVKSVLEMTEKLRSELGSKSERKGVYEAYLSFVNKTFRLVPAMESGRKLAAADITKLSDELDARNPQMADFIVVPAFHKDASGQDVPDPEKSNLEITFAGGSPVIKYATKTSNIVWGKNDSTPQRELCKDLKFAPAPSPASLPATEPTVAAKLPTGPIRQAFSLDPNAPLSASPFMKKPPSTPAAPKATVVTATPPGNSAFTKAGAAVQRSISLDPNTLVGTSPFASKPPASAVAGPTKVIDPKSTPFDPTLTTGVAQ